jgi:hypothetical protein
MISLLTEGHGRISFVVLHRVALVRADISEKRRLPLEDKETLESSQVATSRCPKNARDISETSVPTRAPQNNIPNIFVIITVMKTLQ